MRTIPQPKKVSPFNLKAFLFTSSAVFTGLVANHLLWELVHWIVS